MMASSARRAEELPSYFVDQPNDIRGCDDESARSELVISLRRVDGVWRVVSRYGDDTWWLMGATTNTSKARTKVDFTNVPLHFREVLKAMMYRYLRRGSSGSQRRPGAASLVRTHREMAAFLRYVDSLGIVSLQGITPLVCSQYVHTSRGGQKRLANGREADRRLGPGALYKRLKALENLFELSQYTGSPMLKHPWPDSSANYLSGYSKDKKSGRTPLIPDEVFVALFKRSWNIVEGANKLLDLRDEVQRYEVTKASLHPRYVAQLKTAALRRSGLDGYKQLKMLLTEVRTACYIVIASLSGCRNHELAYLRKGACHSTEKDGERFWWIRSKSTKTFEGDTEWMVPEAAVTALRVMDRWAEPYQTLLEEEIENYRSADVSDVRIAEAQAHRGAVFVGLDLKKGKLVRTLGIHALNSDLKVFAKACGVDWSLASHQFRRKFANYVARSQFGDLRYLREHFKHWSMDMTLGYAMNESQEMSLYLEIQDELDDLKVEVVSTWLDQSESLAGGYGKGLVDWRSRNENITLFKSREAMVRSIAASTPIRSNGHAWCTAPDNLCVGNTLERTRCGDGCSNAVIGKQHKSFYQGLYDHLKELTSAEDIGPGGRQRATRDLNRCAAVLGHLGHDVVTHELP